MKKCVYCKCNLSEDSLIDFCERCGISVWGERMFKAIKQNFKQAEEGGNLDQSSA